MVKGGAAARMDYVEMHDIHHPNCTAAAAQQQLGAGGELRDIEPVDTLLLSSEAYRATEAIEFIAEHLKSDDEYIQVIQSIPMILYTGDVFLIDASITDDNASSH